MAIDPIEQYTRDAQAFRRRRFRRAAMVLGGASVGAGAMVARMTDIGHATAFGGMASGLMFAALTMLYYGLRG